MSSPEDRLLDLALEELYRPCGEDWEAALRQVEHRLAEQAETRPAPAGPGRRGAAIAASLLSLSLASWFVLGRSDRPIPSPQVPASQEAPSESGLKSLIDQLSDADAAVRDRAFAELKRKGPELLPRLREERDRARDAEARARLQELVTYWTHAVAARVGPEIVTWDEVNASFKDLRPSDVTEELRRQSLRRLVEERVFLQEIRRRGIVVSEEELRDGLRRKVEAFGGEEAHLAALRTRGITAEVERDQLRRQLSFQKLQERILEEARGNPGADPFKLDLKETSPEELRRWYDANPDKFSAVDRVDLCWVELPFEGEQERLARKTLAEALVAKSHTKNNLGLAIAEMGIPESIHVGTLERGGKATAPFSEEDRKLILDTFKFGEVRVVEDRKSSILVVQLYDRTRRDRESFELAEPRIRAMVENQRLEANRRRMRDGLLKRAAITPEDLFGER